MSALKQWENVLARHTAITEFVEWLSVEYSLVLDYRYAKPGTPLAISRLIDEFLAVDRQQLEKERRELLEAMRNAHVTAEDPIMDVEVGLEQVWHWNCPICGRDRFVEGIIAELNTEERQELAIEHGVEHIPGDWLVKPCSVECTDCQKEFKVTDLIVEDDDSHDE